MPLKCQRFKLRLMRCWFELFYTPGSRMYLADILSRLPQDATGVEFETCRKVEMSVSKIIAFQDMYNDQIFEDMCARGLVDEFHRKVLTEI